MADNEDRRRILDMLAAGSISVDDASNLLKSLGGSQPAAPAALGAPSAPGAPRRTGGPARLLRISIDEVDPAAQADGRSGGTKVRVNVPLALARFATRFLPKEASAELHEQGIDLEEILGSLGDDLPDGVLVDIVSSNEGENTAKIVIEVV
ncbi:MAG: hypothetical protein WDA03_06590 [Trueperaceae bacterium]